MILVKTCFWAVGWVL